MPRSIQIFGDPATLERIADEASKHADVLGVALLRGASRKPSGGHVLHVHVLNKAVDDVLRGLDTVVDEEKVFIAVTQASAFVDPDRRESIESDADEAPWEEMETGLRNQGRVSVNFVLLMMIGGAIAAVGLVSEPVPQVIAFVSASIISPGFDPLAKISLGAVLKKGPVALRGAWGTLVGYLVLIAAAAAVQWVSLRLGIVTASQFLDNPEVLRIRAPPPNSYFFSIIAAVAGVMMIASLRDTFVVGPLIALLLIPSSAMAGVALATGVWDLVLAALRRFAFDAALVVLAGVAVFFWKQRRFHRRPPLM